MTKTFPFIALSMVSLAFQAANAPADSPQPRRIHVVQAGVEEGIYFVTARHKVKSEVINLTAPEIDGLPTNDNWFQYNGQWYDMNAYNWRLWIISETRCAMRFPNLNFIRAFIHFIDNRKRPSLRLSFPQVVTADDCTVTRQ